MVHIGRRHMLTMPLLACPHDLSMKNEEMMIEMEMVMMNMMEMEIMGVEMIETVLAILA